MCADCLLKGVSVPDVFCLTVKISNYSLRCPRKLCLMFFNSLILDFQFYGSPEFLENALQYRIDLKTAVIEPGILLRPRLLRVGLCRL